MSCNSVMGAGEVTEEKGVQCEITVPPQAVAARGQGSSKVRENE